MRGGRPARKGRPRPILHLYLHRSYWIPGSSAPALSEKCNAFLRLLKNKGFKEESMTKVGLDAIGISTTLESNKSLVVLVMPTLPVNLPETRLHCRIVACIKIFTV